MLRFLVPVLALFAGLYWFASEASPFHRVTETYLPGQVKSAWGRKLDPSGRVPDSGFRAYYFDRRTPDRIVFEENVDSLAIKYAWSDFHGIESPSFAAYWIGKLRVDRPTRKEISVSQSWAKSRILIDGQTVFDGTSASSFPYTFDPGEHVIEVEYINNWHTVEYKVTLEDAAPVLSEEEVSARLQRDLDRPANLYYVGMYESAAKDTHVDVALPKTGKPAILWLTSYEAIDWNIHSSDPVRTIVVSAYAPGSRVRGEGSDKALRLKRWEGVHSQSRQCSCVAGMIHCEHDDDLADEAARLRRVTGRTLDGYAIEYSADTMAVKPYGPAVAAALERQRTADRAAENECVAKANPDFDRMFNSAK